MLELLLRHDGTRWIASNDVLSVAALSLKDLDAAVESTLRASGSFSGRQKVLMTFDNGTIPQWIRQYMPHYFNRIIEVTA